MLPFKQLLAQMPDALIMLFHDKTLNKNVVKI